VPGEEPHQHQHQTLLRLMPRARLATTGDGEPSEGTPTVPQHW
jgi:hypothetical protein